VLFNILGFSIPAILCWISGFPIISGILAASTVFGVFAWKHGWSWYASVSILIGVTINAICAWLDYPPFLVIISTIFILLTWDLSHYVDFLNQAAPSDQVDRMERTHIKNIIGFLFIVTIFSILSITIQLQTSFIIAVILVFLSIAGLLQLIHWLRDTVDNRKNNINI